MCLVTPGIQLDGKRPFLSVADAWHRKQRPIERRQTVNVTRWDGKVGKKWVRLVCSDSLPDAGTKHDKQVLSRCIKDPSWRQAEH
jgi:hypothetical protein